MIWIWTLSIPVTSWLKFLRDLMLLIIQVRTLSVSVKLQLLIISLTPTLSPLACTSSHSFFLPCSSLLCLLLCLLSHCFSLFLFFHLVRTKGYSTDLLDPTQVESKNTIVKSNGLSRVLMLNLWIFSLEKNKIRKLWLK